MRGATRRNNFHRRCIAIGFSIGEADRTLFRSRTSLPQFHAGTRRPCHQLAGLVGDIALDVAQGAARLDDLASAVSLPWRTARRKLIFNSTVVNVSPSPSVAA
jgi:hypothetical protein